MVRFDCLIFGYRKLKISPTDLSLLTSILMRSSVFSTISSDGFVIIRERDFHKTQDLLSGRIEFEYSEPLGLYGKWLLTKNKSMKICAIIISLILITLLSSIVWDVRIEGNESINDIELTMELAECGLEIGEFWNKVERAEIERALVEKDDRIAWVNINRRGTVAYISIIEKKPTETEDIEIAGKYSNIIAEVGCVIEEVTVKSGTAMVKPGDTVKKGDILIAGVVVGENNGGFCNADGMVTGRLNDTISVEIPRKYENYSNYSKELYSVDLNLFKISINIFKLYGKNAGEYDIIEKEITYSLLNKARLPFSFRLNYIPSFSTEICEYSDDEMVMVASERLNSLIASRLINCDLISIRTYGNFGENCYVMTSKIVFNCQIGERVYFDVN